MNRLSAMIAILLGTSAVAAEAPAVEKVGAGSYLTALPPGAKGPKSEITPDGKQPVPTNDWCSSLYWEKFSHPHFAHPLAMEATAAGLRVYYPGPAISGSKDAIFGFMPGKGPGDFTVGSVAVPTFTQKYVDSAWDWNVVVRWGDGDATMTAEYGHGSPFIHFYFSKREGDGARLTFSEAPKVWSGEDGASPRIGLTVSGKHYGFYLHKSTKARWTGIGTKEIICDLNGEEIPGFLSVALLPTADVKTLDRFTPHLEEHDSVSWKYDPTASEVITKLDLEAVDYNRRDSQGHTARPRQPAILALYPHQWRYAENAPFTGDTYSSVRGTMKVVSTDKPLTIRVKFPGVLPALPRVAGGADPARMAEYIRKDIGPDDNGVHDTYGDGKIMGRWACLIPIAEQYGLNAEADLLTRRLKARLEDWLTATDASGKPKAKRVFAYEKNWGTLIGYPAGYGSDQELNDHHFHYGYFLRAAGEVARRDPAWAKDDRFGGMLKLIIRDIASDKHDDPLFPFLRNFDPYAGHSWASGHARFGDGNNQESSSEAMNAWYGMILLGQAIGDTKMRDLGIYLYTTEMTAIEDYWFNVHGDLFPPGYTASVVTMVWGGKGANGTWFSAEPEAVHGINFLPVTGGSLYLGRYPDYVKKNWDAMLSEIAARPVKGKRGAADAAPGEMRQWRDILLMFHALSDPADALKRFDAIAGTLKPEDGNSMANTYHWIATLNALGQVDRSVSADHPLSATFVKDGKKTHVVYRSAAEAKTPVKFSDGVTIEAGKEGWAVK